MTCTAKSQITTNHQSQKIRNGLKKTQWTLKHMEGGDNVLAIYSRSTLSANIFDPKIWPMRTREHEKMWEIPTRWRNQEKNP